MWRRAPARRQLCLGGSLFYNSYFNTRAKRCGAFDDVFVPINPGNAGLAVGNALHALEPLRESVTPFLGPSYSAEEIKESLDNRKLQYQWVSGSRRRLPWKPSRKDVCWAGSSGAMEFGQRALGSPVDPCQPACSVCPDNLNRFLKRREPWRGYALSVAETTAHEYFDGPGSSLFMECDYLPKDPETFRHILLAEGRDTRPPVNGHQARRCFSRCSANLARRRGCRSRQHIVQRIS